jgi:hypothetical protein
MTKRDKVGITILSAIVLSVISYSAFSYNDKKTRALAWCQMNFAESVTQRLGSLGIKTQIRTVNTTSVKSMIVDHLWEVENFMVLLGSLYPQGTGESYTYYCVLDDNGLGFGDTADNAMAAVIAGNAPPEETGSKRQ